MKIAIVGAGVVGVTTAFELSRAGHEVTVFEQRSSAAEEASYAPGALLAPAMLSPWAVPGAMGTSRAFGAGASVEVGAAARMAELRWLWQWRNAARNAVKSSDTPASLHALAQLAQFSQRCFLETAESLELELESSTGALLLMRDERTAGPLRATVEALRTAGCSLLEMDATSARKIEPGLAESEAFSLALHVPGALATNCRQFAVLLRQAAQRLGAVFEFQSSVQTLARTGSGVELHLANASAPQQFDAVVLCNGLEAAGFLETLGVHLGMVALWGTSLTAPLREDACPPQGTVIDAARQVSLSRIGQRIRIAGGAELGRASTEAHENTLTRLYDALDTWFPGCAARGASVQIWRGARVMRPGGLPALGASPIPGVWLNLAHGDSGWSLASGCARALAETMSGAEASLGADAMGHFAVPLST